MGRDRYGRSAQIRGYRNGGHLARDLTVGLGAVAVRVPRASQVPTEVALQGFYSQVVQHLVQHYQRASQSTQQLFARLYPGGLATGDFEPVFRELVGETTAVSPNMAVRLKEHWSQAADRCDSADAPSRQCPLLCVRGGGTAQRQLASVEWWRELDDPGAGGMYLQGYVFTKGVL